MRPYPGIPLNDSEDLLGSVAGEGAALALPQNRAAGHPHGTGPRAEGTGALCSFAPEVRVRDKSCCSLRQTLKKKAFMTEAWEHFYQSLDISH